MDERSLTPPRSRLGLNPAAADEAGGDVGFARYSVCADAASREGSRDGYGRELSYAREGSYGGAVDGGEEGTQIDVFGMLWRRKWLIVLFTVLGVAGGYLHLSRQVRVYQSRAQLYVQQTGPRIINDSGSLYARSNTYLATQAALIKSTPILAATLAMPGVRDARSIASASNGVAALHAMLSVHTSPETEMMHIVATGTVPEDCAMVANAVTDAYIAYQTRTQRNTAAEVLRILTDEKARREAEIDTIFQKMIAFKRANGAMSFEGDQNNIVMRKLGELSASLTTAQLRLIDAKMADETIKSFGDDNLRLRDYLTTASSDGIFAGVRFANADLWGELQGMRRSLWRTKVNLGESHPQVRSLDTELAYMESELHKLDEQTLGNLRMTVARQFDEATRREQELRRAYEAQQELALTLNAGAVEYSKLQSELRRTEQLCDILDARIKEINVIEDAGNLTTTILEVAGVPGVPVSPVASKILMTGLMAGLMLGVGSALLRDWLDPRLQSVDHIRTAIGLNILGILPHIRTSKGTPPRLAAAARGTQVRTAPRSGVAEAYRSLRTTVYLESQQPGGVRTLLVTSPTPGDGKSTVASNLAIAMAQSGRRVLLIDADGRRPTQHHIFATTPDIPPASEAPTASEGGTTGDAGSTDPMLPVTTLGLGDVVGGTTPYRNAVRPTGIDRLDLLPCGRVPPNPAELLDSAAFDELLATVANEYDTVVIDSPPVVPVTDARLLAARCDVTLLVLRARKSTRRHAEHARDALLRAGGNLLGIVVNDVPTGRNGYARDQYYYHGNYTYGDNHDREEVASPFANGYADPTDPGNGHTPPRLGHGNGRHTEGAASAAYSAASIPPTFVDEATSAPKGPTNS